MSDEPTPPPAGPDAYAELERRLLAAETICREKDQLLATISHDLRTPVTAILMWIDVLRRQPNQLTRGLQAIERSAHAQTRILDELLARLSPEEPTRPSETPQSTTSADLRGVTVLVVADGADAHELLASNHATVHTASSVDEALRLWASGRPDVVIVDLDAPDCDGFSLIRAIRGLDPDDGGQTPALALSTSAHPDLRTRALHAGFQFQVSRPIDASELLTALATLCGRQDR